GHHRVPGRAERARRALDRRPWLCNRNRPNHPHRPRARAAAERAGQESLPGHVNHFCHRLEERMSKKFASQADLEEKKVSFDKLSEHAYAYTAEGDPNTGIVIGDDVVMVIDTQATPVMAQDVIRRIRAVTDKPIKYVVLTHYHAVRVLGASGYKPEHIIASRDTYDLIAERGEADMKSEIERFPRLFQAVESVPGLTWPTIVFEKRMTLWIGKLQVEMLQLGRGHTKGDPAVRAPRARILFSGIW